MASSAARACAPPGPAPSAGMQCMQAIILMASSFAWLIFFSILSSCKESYTLFSYLEHGLLLTHESVAVGHVQGQEIQAVVMAVSASNGWYICADA